MVADASRIAPNICDSIDLGHDVIRSSETRVVLSPERSSTLMGEAIDTVAFGVNTVLESIKQSQRPS